MSGPSLDIPPRRLPRVPAGLETLSLQARRANIRAEAAARTRGLGVPGIIRGQRGRQSVVRSAPASPQQRRCASILTGGEDIVV